MRSKCHFGLLNHGGQANPSPWEIPMERSASLVHHLGNVTDPRRGEPVYPLVNVLFMMIGGVITGADDFVAIARFANTKSVSASRACSRFRFLAEMLD